MFLDSYSIKVVKSRKNNDYIILLYNKDELIGYCSFVIKKNLAIGTLSKDKNLLNQFSDDPEIKYAIYGLFASLFIKEKYRGNGLGEKLILYRISLLKKIGVNKLFVESNGNINYHNEIYRGLEEKKILTLEKTDYQTYHYLSF